MIETPFQAILRRAVESTPNAIGGAFACADGEMVDSFATIDAHDWAVLTAHYGIVLQQLHDAFGTWHYGGPEYFIAEHKGLDIVVHIVEGGYFALLAVKVPAPIGTALASLLEAVKALKKEMA